MPRLPAKVTGAVRRGFPPKHLPLALCALILAVGAFGLVNSRAAGVANTNDLTAHRSLLTAHSLSWLSDYDWKSPRSYANSDLFSKSFATKTSRTLSLLGPFAVGSGLNATIYYAGGDGNDAVLAVQVAAPLKYQSKASGDWNNFTTWQVDSGSGFVDATSGQTPTSADDTITILNTHTVTVTASVSADQLTVSSGGTLVVNAGVTLTIDDGVDPDLADNGTVQVNDTGVIAGAGTVAVNSGGTLKVGSGNVTDAVSANVTAPFTLNTGSTVDFNRAGSQTIGARNYYNLILSNSGTKAFGSGTTGIAGSTFSITGTATGDALVNSSTIEYNGTSITILGSFSPYYNLTLNDAAGIAASTALTVNNTLEVKGGSFTNANNSVYKNILIDSGKELIDGGFSLSGDWQNDGTFTPNANAVTLTGGGSQLLTTGGSTSGKTFNTLTIAKSGGTATLAGNLGATALNISGGTFDQGAAFDVSTGPVNITAGTWQNLGTGDLSLSGNVANAGTMTFNANGASCEEVATNDISITSTSGQRSWSGGGTFTMTDVTVSSQGGTVPITVNSGTDGGGNFLNWIFINNCSAASGKTYTWVGPTGPDNSWQTASNWCLAGSGTCTGNPASYRTSPSSTDVLVFDGTTTPTPAVSQVSASDETITALRVINNAFPTFTTDAAHTLTVNAPGSLGFNVNNLNISGANPLTIKLSAGTLGDVTGTMSFAGGGHRLIGQAAGAITFGGSSTFSTQAGFTGNAFGSGSSAADGAADSVRFASGAFYQHSAGGSPFGSTPGTSVVTFQTGSNAQYFTTTFDADGRTYANLIIGDSSTAVSASASGTGNFQFDNLTINSNGTTNSQLTFDGSGTNTITIRGNIQSTGAGSGTVPDLFLTAGSGGIVINRSTPGTITFDTVGNARGIDFESNATVSSGTTLALSRVVLMGLSNPNSRTLTVNGPSGALTGSATGYVVGSLKKTFTGTGSKTFEVGTPNGYSPVEINATAGTFSADFTVSASSTKEPHIHGASVNALKRYWTITGPAPGVVTANLIFNYLDPADIPTNINPGFTDANYILFKYDGSFSTPSATVDTTGNTATINAVSSFSNWTLADLAAVTPGTLAFSGAPYTDNETNADHTKTITVTRSGGGDGAVDVTYATSAGTASPPSDYSETSNTLHWNDGETGDKTFTITVVGDMTCEADETVNITLSNPTDLATISGLNPTTLTITNDDAPPATPTASNGGPYCEGATIQLSTPTVAGATYSWTGPNGFTSALQNPTRASATTADAGTYSVTVTVNGCTSAAGSTNVVVNATPATPTASNTGPYCEGATIQLSTPTVAGATYAWTGPNGFTSALQNPTRASATTADAGTYSVTVTVNGCTSAAGTTNVVVNPTPATPNATNGGPYTEGQTIQLNTSAVGGATYSWTGPNGFTSALQNPTRASSTTADAGTYSVTVTVNGCTSAAGSTNVVVNPTPAEIDVKGLGLSIVDGDISPDTADDTDFGNRNVGVMATHTFTIENTGSSALTISNISLSGTNMGDFTLGALTPASPIPGHSSATFGVTFNPSATGLRTATVTIANNDSDEGSYDFAIQGTGTFPATLVVTKTADTNGTCLPGNCSLREAIKAANFNPDLNAITFDIPTGDPGHYYYANNSAAGVAAANVTATTAIDDASLAGLIDPHYAHSWWSIRPTSALPTIAGPVIIDGYSQRPCAAPNVSPCSQENTLATGENAQLSIELDGTSAGVSVHGLVTTVGASTIQGLVINHFTGNGVGLVSNGNTISGNFIGTDVSGTLAAANHVGVYVDNSSDNAIGCTTPDERNVISGNTDEGVEIYGVTPTFNAKDNLVQGNFIGTDKTGLVDLGNGGAGVKIYDGSNNTIGVDSLSMLASGGNVISGNGSNGVEIASLVMVVASTTTENVVQGNFIGTDRGGTLNLHNDGSGVAIYDADSNVVGGVTSPLGNVIANNGRSGVLVEETIISGPNPAIKNSIRGNSIHDNVALGIDLTPAPAPSPTPTPIPGDGVTLNDDPGDSDDGPNNRQNFPGIASASQGSTSVSGTLNTYAGGTFTIDIYANDACDSSAHGEGKTLLGSGLAVASSNPEEYTFDVTVPTLSSGQVLTATATDQDGNTSEFSHCVAVVATSTSISGSKSVFGSTFPGSTITYTIVLSNNSASDQSDNPGNEFVDVLPLGLTLVSADASGGVATATPATRTVTWNGSIQATDSVTITITATINSGTEGQTITNQGTIHSDADNNGTNEATTTTNSVGFVVCPATRVVTTSADSGAGSLRQAILDACPGTIITFDTAGVFATQQTITLTTGELVIDKDLTIHGPTASALTISGNNNSRVFNVQSGNSLLISNLTIAGGRAINGGGIFSSGNLTITDSTFTDNHAVAGQGGAIDSEGGNLVIINSTISGNTADLDGGGLLNGGNSIAVLANVTITNNRADADGNASGAGGGLGQLSSGNLTLNNTIIAANFAGAGTSPNDVFVNVGSGSFLDASSSNNLIGVDTGLSDISNGSNGNKVGTAAVPLNPSLNALANNGGPTKTHRLLWFSPAVNAGGNDLARDQVGALLTKDQRGTGFARVVNGTVDIGAFEANYVISTTAGTPQSALVNTAFATNLQATVTESGTTLSGLSVTFTAPASGASGTFAGGGTTVSVNTNGSGVATATTFTANAIAGPYNVVASLSGGTPSANFALTNIKADQTITVNTHAPAGATFNSNFTVAATASSGLPVTYSSSGSCSNVGATFTMTSGTGTCTVKYDQIGNANYNAAPQVTEVVTAQKAATTTALSSSVNPSNSGQSVTFTATVTSVAGTPSGTVTFKDNGVAISGCSNKTLASGQATCNTSGLAPGNHPITADYNGDTNFATSTGTLAGGQVVNSEVSVTVSPSAVAEDGAPNLVYTFTRNGVTSGSLTVNFSVGGTAAFTTDYTQTGAASFSTTAGTVTFGAGNSTATVTIDPTPDTTSESDETLILTVTSGTGYTVGGTSAATGTITNDDTSVSVAVAPSSVEEDSEPNLVYTFTRNGVTSGSLTVNFSVSGTAAFNTDYTQSGAATFSSTSGSVTFDAGNATATVTINPTTDTELELGETVILTVTSGTGYNVASPSAATGTITNDDTALQLLLDPAGPASNQAVAVDSILFMRDPFPIDRLEQWFNFPGDDNTRVMLFAYFQLLPGETANDVQVNVIDSNNHSYDVTAEDVRLVTCAPCSQPLSQVTFRLPDMPAGTVTVRVKVHILTSNAGTFRVAN